MTNHKWRMYGVGGGLEVADKLGFTVNVSPRHISVTILNKFEHLKE